MIEAFKKIKGYFYKKEPVKHNLHNGLVKITSVYNNHPTRINGNNWNSLVDYVEGLNNRIEYLEQQQ